MVSCFEENSLLALPLALKLPTNECVYCPTAPQHKDGAIGEVHLKAETEYLEFLEDCKAASLENFPLEPYNFDGPSLDNYRHGIAMLSTSVDYSSNHAILGISLTAVFDQAHIVETLIHLAERFHHIHVVIITDPYVGSQTCKMLQKANAWGVNMSLEDARKSINAVKIRDAAAKLIIQKFRIVRRAVKVLFGEELYVNGSDLDGNGEKPRFTWVQWTDAVSTPLYTNLRASLAESFKNNPEFRTEVLSIAHHPVLQPTAAETAAETLSDSNLLPHEVELFTDYFLSEHAFFASLPTLLKCPGANLLLPYHCESRALPFIFSSALYNPVSLGLVEPLYDHTDFALAVLPTSSSNSRASNPIEYGNYQINVVSPASEMPPTPLSEMGPPLQFGITEASLAVDDSSEPKSLLERLLLLNV